MTLAEVTPAEVVNHELPVPISRMSRMSPAEVADRARWIREVTKAALIEGTDYGVIPGTDKPTLYKSGAETLLFAAGLGSATHRGDIDLDENGRRLGVYYKTTVLRGDTVIAECEGYAGYDESRFYTSAEEATQRERENAAKYQRSVRESKCAEYRAPWNTVVKMAQKRALVGATLIATSASGLFTQDLEDDHGPAGVAAPAFDPMALIGPALTGLDKDGKKELSEWRKAEGLPDPRQMNPEQAAAALVKIGELIARQPAAQTDSASSNAPEAAPEGVKEEAGGQVDNQAAGPSATTLSTDTSKLITKTQAQKLRKDLGRSVDTDGHGLASADQDDLIFCVTEGRTTHASELTVGEEALVRQFAGNIRSGRMSIGDVHRAAEEHRTKQLDSALQQSLDQQADGHDPLAEWDAATDPKRARS